MCARPANDRDQAKRIHDRIAGVPPSAAVLDQMEALVAADDAARRRAHRDAGAILLQRHAEELAVPWTNRDQTVFAPLNDYIATVIGMVRDDVAVQHRAVGRLLYTVNGVDAGRFADQQRSLRERRDQRRRTCSAALTPTTQSSVHGIPAAATAGRHDLARRLGGVLHRRHQPRDVPLHDDESHVPRHGAGARHLAAAGSHPPGREPLSPGGDSRIFLNNCIGCHSGMDPMAQAFAYYNFDETQPAASVYTPRPRCSRSTSSTTTTSSRASSRRMTAGTTAGARARTRVLGWSRARCPAAATAPSRMGQELANSDAFAQCQVEKVFKTVCFRAPGDAADRTEVAQHRRAHFKANGYQLKQVFAETAVYCMGD